MPALGILDADRVKLEQFLVVGIDDEAHQAIGDLPRGQGILGELIRNPSRCASPISATTRAATEFPPGHPPMTTFLGVPIVIRGQAWGNLYLTEKVVSFDNPQPLGRPGPNLSRSERPEARHLERHRGLAQRPPARRPKPGGNDDHRQGRRRGRQTSAACST